MLWQPWSVRLYWQHGRSNYERSCCRAWPVGTSAIKVITDAAADPGNGCDLARCTTVEASQCGEPYESPEPVAPPKGQR